ncbi:hypothetical protein FVER53590_05434 [Fusarium verticillioides]|nr:hypothetical protein FVER53590_05434 [Fusarium verticillioides]
MKFFTLIATIISAVSISAVPILNERAVGGLLICTGANSTGTCTHEVYTLNKCHQLSEPFLRNVTTFAPDGEHFNCYPRTTGCNDTSILRYSDIMAFTTNATINSFGGRFLKLSHKSAVTGTPMNATLYLPGSASSSKPAPLLIYLSGLTCTPDNVTEKGFLHAHASKLGLALLYPDTSPRELDLPGEHDSYDFGSGAGFYIDAKKDPYSKHYKMESYITNELPDLIFKEFKEVDSSRVSISGHSMGGHGALTLFLKNPGKYKSVSAWAPISNPSQCPWGDKAFKGYLGEDKEEWKKHDATELIKSWKGNFPALIDVGTGDNFYKQGQLLPENLEKAVKDAGIEGLTLRYQDGYDHSYFFISTFGEDHVKHAAKALGLL